jgi:ribose transport system ATP-binding protein
MELRVSEDATAIGGGVIPLLQVRNLSKRFGAIHALSGVSLEVRPGEIHGLVGANGAGKSTLVKTLAGLHAPDQGEVLLDGRPVTIKNPQHAGELGLEFIHQELNLVPKFTGRQNMTLGVSPTRGPGLMDWSRMRAQTEEVARRLDITFSLDVPVEKLSVAERWLISIGRALVRKARLIAMDEPTASLSGAEADRLFRIVRELAADGVAILYVSHRLDEITSLCSRVTVFKDGRNVAAFDRASMNKADIIRAIVGGDVATLSAPKSQANGSAVVLQVKGLRREPAIHDLSFEVHAGEVLGLAGLVGAGRTETARILFGADKAHGGEMLLDGKPYAPSGTHEAVKAGIFLVPEERRSQGLILRESVAFNVDLPSWRLMQVAPVVPIVSKRKGARLAANAVESLRIKTESVQTPVSKLSGGNQQKVVMGKWLGRKTRVLILDEPTRGVDVGARAEIHRIIRELADQGIAVIVISSEFQELADCNRVLVMADGRVVGELTSGEISEEAILHQCYSHQAAESEE